MFLIYPIPLQVVCESLKISFGNILKTTETKNSKMYKLIFYKIKRWKDVVFPLEIFACEHVWSTNTMQLTEQGTHHQHRNKAPVRPHKATLFEENICVLYQSVRDIFSVYLPIQILYLYCKKNNKNLKGFQTRLT